MKNITLFFVFLAFLLCPFVSAAEEITEIYPGVTVKEKSVLVQEEEYLIKKVYPAFGEESRFFALNRKIAQIVDDAEEKFFFYIKKYGKDSVSATDIMGYVTYIDSTIVSLRFRQVMTMGLMEPFVFYENVCFRYDTGKFADFENTFGTRENIEPLVKEKLNAVRGEKGYGPAESLFGLNVFDFTFSDKGVTWYFSPGSTGTSSQGAFYVTLSYEELKDKINKTSPVYDYVSKKLLSLTDTYDRNVPDNSKTVSQILMGEKTEKAVTQTKDFACRKAIDVKENDSVRIKNVLKVPGFFLRETDFDLSRDGMKNVQITADRFEAAAVFKGNIEFNNINNFFGKNIKINLVSEDGKVISEEDFQAVYGYGNVYAGMPFYLAYGKQNNQKVYIQFAVYNKNRMVYRSDLLAPGENIKAVLSQIGG